MKKLLLNYADARFQGAQRANTSSGLELGGFTDAVSHSRAEIDADFARRHADVLGRPRGQGYWLWKAYFILHHLEQLGPDDFIFYSDSGAVFVGPLDPELVEACRQDPKGLVLFWNHPSLLNRLYTKRDCFILMGLDAPRYAEARQVTASYQLVRRTEFTLEFYRECLKFGGDPRVITDEANSCGLENLPGFIEHRHDQSITSLLREKHQVLTRVDPSQYGNAFRKGASRQFLFHHRAPNFRRDLLPIYQAAVTARRLGELKLPVVTSFKEKPVVMMSTLGQNGRFGNQLFQYLFLRLVAQKQSAILQTPAKWTGRVLFGFNDPAIDRPALPVNETQLPRPEALFDGTDAVTADIDLQGYFQLHTSKLVPHRDFIRNLFIPSPALLAPVSRVLQILRPKGRPLIVLHLRRGDYGYRHYFRAPALWYLRWLEEISTVLCNPVVYICTDDPEEVLPHFARWNPQHFGSLSGIPPTFAYLIDFYALAAADAVAISNSSYSFMASMLNDRAGTFMRPTLESRELISFDPWNSSVLLERELAPGEQEAITAEDLAAVC